MGKASVEQPSLKKTFLHELLPSSNIYHLLKDLRLMNFWVGDDDITADKDAKHIFKRGRNRPLRKAGTDVIGVEITSAIIRTHLQSESESSDSEGDGDGDSDKEEFNSGDDFVD
jgi:hypothetical protein